MRRFLAFGPAFVVLVACGLVLLLAPTVVRRVSSAHTRAVVEVAQRTLDGEDVLERLNAAVRNIARATEPSVVHIDVYGSGRVPMGASGSGWVFDTFGHIITNAHVVDSADEVRVQYFDGHVTRAEVVGADRDTDIAVLRVDNGADRVPARRATGERVQIGDRVFAFGSPFGFKFSMSEGIVSGLGRSASTPAGRARISNFIQTDAAVNPGNSGGPLVDIRGRVVGMNVAIATANTPSGMTEGQSAGISFAIPLGTIESRVRQILSGGPIESGFIGIRFLDSGGIAAEGKPLGVHVDDVIEGGPAEEAGLRVGDIITAIDDEAVIDGNVLLSIIGAKAPGDIIRLRVWRSGKTLDITSRIVKRPPDTAQRPGENRLWRLFGFALIERERGVFVARIGDGSPAAAAGLSRGQRVESIAGRKVISVEGALEALTRAGLFNGSAVTLKVASDQDTEFKELTLGGEP